MAFVVFPTLHFYENGNPNGVRVAGEQAVDRDQAGLLKFNRLVGGSNESNP